jgi:capsular exopolysaccharide synthesis family protein
MSVYELRMQKLPAQESQLARLMRQKDVYEKIFTLLLDKREEMRIAEVSKLQDIIIVDPPQKPLKPISPNKMMNMVVGLVLGGFLGLVLIFVIELKNNRLINVDDLEDDFQLPVLAILPKYPREILKRIKNATENKDKFASLMDENLGIKESIRLLKTKILLHLDSNDKIILVTSCEENTGKTTLVSNLAITFALENKKVLIIDCDLKKGELSRLFNLSLDTPGLVHYLSGEPTPSIYTKVMKKIDIIPAGGLREDSAALLDSDRMKNLVDTLNASEYDYVLIDTAPVTRVVDTLVLGRIIKNALLVVRPGVSFKETVVTGIQEMKQAKFKVRGIIANAVELKKSYTYRYKYGYGYGYGHSTGGNGQGSGKIIGKISKLTSKSKSGTL